MSAALVAVVAITLLSSGLEHLRGRSAALSETLAGHRVLPATWTSPVAAVLTVLEVALGLALLVGLSRGTAATGMLALVASALFAAMTGYVHLAARRAERGAPVPCGCGLGEAPLGLWVTVRAGLLAALALIGGLTLPTEPLSTSSPSELVIMAAATLALSIAIITLPQARAELAISRPTGVTR